MGSRRQASNRLFTPDLCDKQALDFIGLKNRRKTYPLRNERQKNRRQFGGLYRFVYCLAIETRWKPRQCYDGFLNSRQKGSNCLMFLGFLEQWNVIRGSYLIAAKTAIFVIDVNLVQYYQHTNVLFI